MKSTNQIKVLSAVTVSDSVIFFYGMPSFLNRNGFNVAISATPGPELDMIRKTEFPIIYEVEMKREISIFDDFRSLFNVLKALRDFRPNIVNAGTPKAGFLYILASWLIRTPVRIYHVRGLRHESLYGFKRILQVFIEKVCGYCATHIVCETQSLKELSLRQKLYSDHKCFVLGPGSSGVELSNFRPETYSVSFKSDMKKSLGIPPDALVIGFLGRMVPRKGVGELISAWSEIREKFPNVYLLLAGPYEDAQPILNSDYATIQSDKRIISVGKVENPAIYYSIMDIFTLPAHWEGFGNVLVEAAAMGVPVVTTKATGTIDAVKNDFNGQVIEVKNSKALAQSLMLYLQSEELRSRHGHNGITWARKFDRELILKHLSDFYRCILKD